MLFVVLVKNVVFDFIALGFHKQIGPENKWRHVVSSHEFSISATAIVESLFVRSIIKTLNHDQES